MKPITRPFYTLFLPTCLTLVLSLVSLAGFSQVTKIMGTARDAVTKEPLPFVNIVIKGTTAGTLTDFDGYYAIETRVVGDSLQASLMGYASLTKRIVRNQFQVIDFEMTPTTLDLPEVTIRYKGNPAEVIIEKVVQNKERNSIQSFDSYQFESYTKIELDANNISDKLKTIKLLKSFQFVFDYIDTSTVNGKSYLPVFISEALSDVYFRKSPRVRKEIIKATRVSGLETMDLSQFMGNFSVEINVYNNFFPIFQKNFISPISDFGITHYKYYLVDSAFVGSHWCYHIMYKPRHKQELTFSGNLWVTDTTFAVKKIDMKIAGDANINFINDMMLTQEYEWTDGRFWMLTKDKVIVDFNVVDDSKKLFGFFGYRSALYRNFQFNLPDGKEFKNTTTNITVKPDAAEKGEAFWIEQRPEQLSAKEAGVYQMVDSVKNVPVYRTYLDILKFLVRGYINCGKFELGSFYQTYSYNGLEGNRFRFGGKTTFRLSKKLELDGYVAYGTWDQTFKYGITGIYLFRSNPRRALYANYKYDVEQLGSSPKAISTDNIFGSLFHRGPNNKLTMVRTYDAAYEHEWFSGFITTFGLNHREVFPLGTTEFITYPEPGGVADSMKSIFTTEARLDLRLSFQERYVMGQYRRISISSKFPIINLGYAYGFKNVFRSDYGYQKISLTARQIFKIANIGWSKYILEGGKIWGKLPYPLLKIHDGNQTFFFDEYASNLMNYYEFVSDEYIALFYTHHFDGLLLNRIPLVRKLKWREVVHIRAVYGSMTSDNETFSAFPGQMRGFGNEAYWETGAGIENIFKFLRIDAIWRLTHLDDHQNPNAGKFGVFASAMFNF